MGVIDFGEALVFLRETARTERAIWGLNLAEAVLEQLGQLIDGPAVCAKCGGGQEFDRCLRTDPPLCIWCFVDAHDLQQLVNALVDERLGDPALPNQ